MSLDQNPLTYSSIGEFKKSLGLEDKQHYSLTARFVRNEDGALMLDTPLEKIEVIEAVECLLALLGEEKNG